MSGLSGRIEDGRHRFPLRVYYEDTDSGGIVYYANYLKYAERARTEMLRLVGIGQTGMAQEHDAVFAVRDCAIDYLRPARLDDFLEVRSHLVELAAATLRAVQAIYRDDDEIVRLDVRIACLRRDGRPVRIPAPVRAALSPYCGKT